MVPHEVPVGVPVPKATRLPAASYLSYGEGSPFSKVFQTLSASSHSRTVDLCTVPYRNILSEHPVLEIQSKSLGKVTLSRDSGVKTIV